MPYQIIEKYISKNRPGTKLTPIGIVVHDTATPGATDEAEFKYFDGGAAGRSASAHAFIDWDSITRTIPFNEQAWHAGGTANHKFIGIELCRPATHDIDKFNEVWLRATWLFADTFINVLKIKTVTKDNLMSHAEVSAKWHETDHQDPVAYFKEYGKTVDEFRVSVQAMINALTTPSKPAAPAYPKVALSMNSIGPAVKLVQAKLKITQDGVFGKKTKDALVMFQKLEGLLPDGVVGPKTWEALFS